MLRFPANISALLAELPVLGRIGAEYFPTRTSTKNAGLAPNLVPKLIDDREIYAATLH